MCAGDGMLGGSCCLGSLPFFLHGKFWDDSIRASLVQAQAAMPGCTSQILALCVAMKAAVPETLGVQGGCMALWFCRALWMGLCSKDAPFCSRRQIPELGLAE